MYDTPPGVGGKIDTSGNILSGPMAGQTAAITPPTAPYYSSEKGQTLVQDASANLTRLSQPTNASDIKAGQSFTDSNGNQGVAKFDPKTGQPFTPTAPEKTGQGLTISEVTDLSGGDLSGYKLNTDGTYSPKPQLNPQEQAVENARSDYESFVKLLQGMGFADADTSGISSSWDARIAEMEKSNTSHLAAITQSGIRSGSQYTGGAGGVWGSIFSGEEIAGIGRIKDLQSQKMGAIASAKQAAEEQNWERMVKLTDIAQTKYNDQLDALSKLNEATAKQDAKIKAETAISSVFSSGVTDPNEIFKTLSGSGTPVTTADIKEFISNVRPDSAALSKLIETARNNGAPDSVLTSIGTAGDLNAAYQLAGAYAAGGSGIIGEYNYAKANGYSGTFSDYQNEDANRKKSIAKAGVAGGSDLPTSILTKVETIANQLDSEQVVKDYNTTATQANYMATLGDKPTDDIARVYAFAKVMDPNSVVREGEYKTVQDYAQAVFQSAGLKAKRVFTNTGFLTDEARSFLQTTLTGRLQTQEKTYKNIYNEYGRRINKITGSTDGTDYLTDYSKGYSSADEIVNDDKKVQDTIATWVTEAPENKAAYDQAQAIFPNATPAELKAQLQIP